MERLVNRKIFFIVYHNIKKSSALKYQAGSLQLNCGFFHGTSIHFGPL